MALNISAWAIRKPVPSIVLFVVLTAIGLYTFDRLPITRMPNIDLPIVSVTIVQPGAAPSELETQVTKIVETSVAGVQGVKHITSTITEGTSLTVVEFQLETQVDRAVNDVRDAVTNVRSELPQDIEEPLIQRVDVEGMAIDTYAASAPGMTPEELSWFVDDTVIRSLQGVRGVAQVKREGGVDREIRISLDPDKLAALGVTAADVNRQLVATNVDLAGGRGEIGTQEQSVRTLGGALSVADLAETRIALPAGSERVRALCAPRRPRQRHRRGRRAAHLRPPRRQAGGRLRRLPRQGLFRRGGGGERGSGAAQARGGASGRADHADRLDGEVHQGGLRIRHAHAHRGRGAGGDRGHAVPARLARHHRHGARHTRCRSCPPSGSWTFSASR